MTRVDEVWLAKTVGLVWHCSMMQQFTMLETFWPVPSFLAIQWIHQAPSSCVPSSAWRCELEHYRSLQNPHWSKQWSKRCGLQLHTTVTAMQHIPCPWESSTLATRSWSAVTTTQRHQSRSWGHWQFEVLVQRTHCNIFAWTDTQSNTSQRRSMKQKGGWSQMIWLRYDSHITRGNEIIFKDPHNCIQDDENNVCLWLTTSLRPSCHLSHE